MAKIAHGKKILLRIDKDLRRFFEKKWEKPCAVVDIGPIMERCLGLVSRAVFE